MIGVFLPLLVLGNHAQEPQREPTVIPLRIPTEKDSFGLKTPPRRFICFLSDTKNKKLELSVDLPAFLASDNARSRRFASVEVAKNNGETSSAGARLFINEQKEAIYSLYFWLDVGNSEEASYSAVRMYITPVTGGYTAEMWPNIPSEKIYKNPGKFENSHNLRLKAAGLCNPVAVDEKVETLAK
jgi:hypothetical protein